MEAPTSIKIWAPASAEAFDATAEPTLEDQNGSDILGAAIADTEQAINAMDGRPGQLLTVDTSGERTTFRIDLEANLRKTYDALIVDNHNLLSAYPLAIRDLLNIYKHIADDDALASATEVTYSKIMSGLLGQRRPRLKFDEINDKVATATDADLAYDDTTPFSLSSIFNTSITGSNKVLIGLHQSASAANNDVISLQLNAGTLVFYLIEAWAGSYIAITTDDTFNDGEDHKVLATYDGTSLNTGMEIYVDGVLQSVTRTGAGTVTGFVATNTLEMGNNAKWQTAIFYGGYQNLNRLWNRELTAAEALTLYGYWTHTPIPMMDQYGSQTAIYTSDFSAGVDNWAAARGTVDGNIDGISDGVDSEDDTLRFFADANAGLRHIFHTGTNDPFTVGLRYRVTFDAYVGKDGGGANTSCDGFALIFSGDSAHAYADGFGASGAGSGSAGAWTSYVAESDALGADFMFVALDGTDDTWVGQNVNTDDLIYIKNVVITRVGCVAEYSHDGISAELGKWLDASGNDLHGTVTGCEYVDTPDDDNFGFYLAEFTAVVDWLFWFLQFVQNDGATNASADTFLGWLPLLKSYTFGDLVAGGYAGTHSFGVISRVSDVGRVLTEEIHGEQPSWNLTWRRLTAAQWADLVEMLRVIKPGTGPSLYPFYICFNYDAQDPVIWRVRMVGPLAWTYNGANTYKWSPTMTVVRDL